MREKERLWVWVGRERGGGDLGAVGARKIMIVLYEKIYFQVKIHTEFLKVFIELCLGATNFWVLKWWAKGERSLVTRGRQNARKPSRINRGG